MTSALPFTRDDKDLINDTFVRCTVLETMLIELLGAYSIQFEEPPAFRTQFFVAIRERFSQRLTNPKAFGEAEYAKLALKIADQTETHALHHLGGDAQQG
ncbi:hypothetical protein [Ciceribacter ferrooxidans]|uniref:Uncharacterized protein n=1 Tax=Ciceribacter ferrooxidans TaxID=2509717 RepID=A0A4Q2T0F4_9HYPH|nr:hypothetical protein [Ciceribacter ferrooxidans]RYC10148.1 hypothetical protein EUU22_18965 [Ciceribacter ferrooxidans]